MISRARPDVEAAAERLLGEARRARGGPAVAVTLHGDANLRNALLLANGDVALLDLEHLSCGPGRRRPRPGAGRPARRALARAARPPPRCCAGYGEVARTPDRAALRWHTAASVLARVALPAVSRFRPRALAQLRGLLDAGAGLLSEAEVAA